MAAIDSGANTANKANVNQNYQLEVHTPTTQSQAGFVCVSSENDAGVAIGSRTVAAPQTDANFRFRTSVDQFLDIELFNYAAQNTGKHSFAFTTLTCTAGINGILTNSGNINTTATGCTFGTFAFFPIDYTKPMYCETSASFSAQPQSNVVIDFGVFLRGATTAFAPTDGVYFRLTSAGMFGVVNNNGTETTTAVFPLAAGAGTWVYVNNTVYRFQIVISTTVVQFFINDVLYGSIATPVGQASPVRSAALPWSFRHAILAGGAGGSLQATFASYGVGIMGPPIAENMGTLGNRTMGSYQGLSGGTMGSLAAYTNNLAPTAGVQPTNATAALGTGLGGQYQELFTLALNTDGIICSYQVPAGTTAVQGRRLRIHGVRIDGFVAVVLAGGPVNAIWALNFGHTAVSLATAEGASFSTGTTKAPRRIVLGQQDMAVTTPVGTALKVIDVKFVEPIYVNPGEFVAISKKYYGTVGTAGVIENLITIDYGWE